MPKKDRTPEGLKPYAFHGIDFNEGSKEATAECPFCGKEDKFTVDIESGKWRCFTCDEGGNQYTFLAKLWEIGIESTNGYEPLAKERGLTIKTLVEWGVVKSPLTDEWLVPGQNAKGEIRQLYRYVKLKNGKLRLLATPTINHQIHGVNLYDPKKPIVYLCEGPWDAMKLWETLSRHKNNNGDFVKTKSIKNSLLGGANVLAVPGCLSFRQSWCDVFLGKKVYVVFDNDYPRKHPTNGKMIEPSALAGVKKISSIIGSKSEAIEYVNWGEDVYHDESLENGADVRDLLKEGVGIGEIFRRLCPVPEAWKVSEKQQALTKRVGTKKCERWIKLSNQWRKAFKWGDGLDTTLSVMLASILSTELPGDQLWIKVIGPASCGKSTLCEAVSVNKKYILAKSTIRGFHSGFKTDAGGEEDNSLIVQSAGKTLVTKDGDTLLQSPNLGQILSEARDIYDKTSRTHYRNKMSKEYSGINMTWLLCGTSSLRSIDKSELGERFLDCVIMEGIDDEMEDEVLLRVAEREDRNLSFVDEGEGDDDKDMLEAKKLTGGYVNYLRENDRDLMRQVVTPKENLLKITRIGKFVSYMRARPSLRQMETIEREFGARLVSQHLRLAKCLAVVLNKKEVDSEVMRRVSKVALDTARGLTLNICRELHAEGEEGLEPKTIALAINQNEDQVRKLLRFLKAIGGTEQFSKKSQGIRARKKWRLTAKLKELFEEVVGE